MTHNAYYEVVILPHHAGFGMWQAGEANGEPWADPQALLVTIADAWYPAVPRRLEDGAALPEGAEDIRGKICNEPDEVYVMADPEQGLMYFGILTQEWPMSCRVCGDESARWYESQRQALCKSCRADTPVKVGRSAFESQYWEGKAEEVPLSTRREFYSDYLASTYTVGAYIKATRSSTM